MKHGDFSELARYYSSRPGYSLQALSVIKEFICSSLEKKSLLVADVGAGTGKLTENLSQLGLEGYAIEPNDKMRKVGIELNKCKKFKWIKGSAEVTTLGDNSVDWILMGSSFHWTDAPAALAEFNRVLRPNGFFTAIWNPRDIESSEFHQSIEDKIKQIVPELCRVSSGSANNMKDMNKKLLNTPYFNNLFFVEAPFEVYMSQERYLNVWRSVNDIQVQAGSERFNKILEMIQREIKELDSIMVPYKARAWTVQSTKK